MGLMEQIKAKLSKKPKENWEAKLSKDDLKKYMDEWEKWSEAFGKSVDAVDKDSKYKDKESDKAKAQEKNSKDWYAKETLINVKWAKVADATEKLKKEAEQQESKTGPARAALSEMKLKGDAVTIAVNAADKKMKSISLNLLPPGVQKQMKEAMKAAEVALQKVGGLGSLVSITADQLGDELK